MSDPVPEMVERATKAYVEKLFNCQWDREGPVFRRKHMEAMQAAIKAMREPTARMIERGKGEPIGHSWAKRGGESLELTYTPEAIWKVMIDEALHHGPM